MAPGVQFGTTASTGPTFAPNLPAGYTTIMDRQWNPTDSSIPGGVLPPPSLTGTDSFHMEWFGGSPSVVPLINTPAALSAIIGTSVAALPDGNPTCLAIKWTSGFPAANVPFQTSYIGSGLPATKMYCSCWMYQPNTFTSNGNNMKWFGFQNTIGNGSGGTANHLTEWSSQNNPASDGRGVYMITQGGGGTGSYGGQSTNTAGAIDSLPIPPPQGTGPGWWASNVDGWHCLEWFMQTESNPGISSDGVFKGWFDGTLINFWNNIKYNGSVAQDGGAFNLWGLIPYYGGGGGNAPSDVYLLTGRTLVAVHA